MLCKGFLYHYINLKLILITSLDVLTYLLCLLHWIIHYEDLISVKCSNTHVAIATLVLAIFSIKQEFWTAFLFQHLKQFARHFCIHVYLAFKTLGFCFIRLLRNSKGFHLRTFKLLLGTGENKRCLKNIFAIKNSQKWQWGNPGKGEVKALLGKKHVGEK